MMGISTDKPDLFTAILAMDSYNRGYDAGIKDDTVLSRLPNTRIGNAVIIVDEQGTSAQAAGFYGIAYDLNGQTIISYRGTNNPNPLLAASDIWNGWTIGAGFTPFTQAGLAIKFYQDIINRNGGSK